MSSLWTPGGERPVGREPSGPSEPPPREPFGGPDDVDREPTAEELAALTRELASTPVAVVVANHAMGLFELAALHLSQQPPNLAESAMAIDSMAALVEGLAGRLGENEPTLKDALAQLRMAFVQIKAGLADEAPPPNSALFVALCATFRAEFGSGSRSDGGDGGDRRRLPLPEVAGADVVGHLRADLDRSGAVGDRRAVEEARRTIRAVVTHPPDAGGIVELDDRSASGQFSRSGAR